MSDMRFSAAVIAPATLSSEMPSDELKTVIHRVRGNGIRQCKNDVFCVAFSLNTERVDCVVVRSINYILSGY